MAVLRDGNNLDLEFKFDYKSPKSTSLNLEFNTSFNPDGLRSAGLGNTSRIGSLSIQLKQSFIKPKSNNFLLFGSAKVAIDTLNVRPVGIDSTIQVGMPEYVSWRKYLQPSGIMPPVLGLMINRIRLLGGYNAPNGGSLNLNWFQESYVPPNASNLNLDFGQLGYNNVIATLGVQSDFGTTRIEQQKKVTTTGFIATRFGTPELHTNKGRLQPYPWSSNVFGQPSLNNNARRYYLTGFVATLFGGVKVELYRRFLLAQGISDSVVSDKAFVQGGKRFLSPPGKASLEYGKITVVNTRASQTVVPPSINDWKVASPKVFPLIIFQKSFVATVFGNAIVQRNPSPLGFVNTRYGQTWVSLNPRPISPIGFNVFGEGYPKVFDPKQTIYQQLTPITGGIFGDIKLRNKNIRVDVQGFDSSVVSQWLSAESNLRIITGRADNYFTNLGSSTIFNKTPSIHPTSIVGAMGSVHIDYVIRYISVPGITQYAFGIATLFKPPEISPTGQDYLEFGNQWISNRKRTIEVSWIENIEKSNHTIWHRVRQFSGLGGISSLQSGRPKIEHGIRYFLIQGYIASAYGKPTIDFRVREIEVESIITITNSNHIVAGTQFILPNGYIASLFGERITPEDQNVYAKGIFSNFGISKVWLYFQYLKPRGFDTENTFLHGRWGTQKLWNKRQYIAMYYDPDSLLNPPKGNSKWLVVGNRNRELWMYGSTLSLYGRPSIQNKAVPIYPLGKDWISIGKHRISHYIQRALIESIEAPYLSGWSNVHNNADVLKAKGVIQALFGRASLENTRRYRKIDGFESSVFGYPFIADRIREITFEARYGIAPPRIELPVIDLYSRYIEPLGINKEGYGSSELNIYRARIISRWAHTERTGTPDIRNVTPEVKARGKASDEFGNAYLKLSKSYHKIDGYIATLIPKHLIEFRTRTITVRGMQMMVFGPKLKVVRIGSTPYVTQFVDLNYPYGAGIPDENKIYDGYGIGIPGEYYLGGPPTHNEPKQVPPPKFNRDVLTRVTCGDTAIFGDTFVSANTIRVEPGIQEYLMGEPDVSLKNRKLEPSSIQSTLEYGKPRLSPHTIWAVREAPAQAQRNHPVGRDITYVNNGAKLGSPTLTLQHRTVRTVGTSFWTVSNPIIGLKINYIRPASFSPLRFGWHTLPEWIRAVEQFGSIESMVFGKPTLKHIYWDLRQYLTPAGIRPPVSDTWSLIEFFHRQFQLKGFESLEMGVSKSSDIEFFPQSLHVGFPKPVRMIGKDASLFGKAYISHRVREVGVSGFDSFISTYTLEKYKERLKVIRIKPEPPMFKVIHSTSTIMTLMGTPNIRLKVQYIRPDGNSDQYRKGVPE